jgi:YggT family protein
MGRAECGRDAPGSVAFLDGCGLFARGKEAKRRTPFDPREFPQPMRALLDVVLLALQLYTWIIIASAILSWLVAFNVVNVRNEVVRSIWNFLDAVTEPVLRPIRNLLPNLGGIDVSPIILLLIIFFIERIIVYYLYPAVF